VRISAEALTNQSRRRLGWSGWLGRLMTIFVITDGNPSALHRDHIALAHPRIGIKPRVMNKFAHRMSIRHTVTNCVESISPVVGFARGRIPAEALREPSRYFAVRCPACSFILDYGALAAGQSSLLRSPFFAEGARTPA
jgi:hypothetical protein